MILHFNVTGESRKKMVRAIEEATGQKAKYLGVPSCAYRIGDYTVGKNGELEYTDSLSTEKTAAVIEASVTATGLSPVEWTETEEKAVSKEVSDTAEETPQSENMGLTIGFPLENVMVGNLTKLLGAKGNLIKKALNLDALPIEVTEDKVNFPWWDTMPEDFEEITAYTNFLAALCRMSKEQKRITAKEKAVDNEKYAFRCFLLRLGFIGAEYKKDRKILLKNLTGSSAFKSTKEAADDEISE
jgi:hypothetical protein